MDISRVGLCIGDPLLARALGDIPGSPSVAIEAPDLAAGNMWLPMSEQCGRVAGATLLLFLFMASWPLRNMSANWPDRLHILPTGVKYW